MGIHGLVVTLTSELELAQRAEAAILEAGPFELGPRQGSRLPLVLEVQTEADAQRWHDWLGELAGVVKVDVAFVSVEKASHTGEGEDDER